MKIHSHYDNLKVSRDAPQEVIRAAYKTLSQKYHPDRRIDDPDAERVMKIINASYAVLSDPVQRKEHDEWLARKEREAAAAAAPPPPLRSAASSQPKSQQKGQQKGQQTARQTSWQAAAQTKRESAPRPQPRSSAWTSQARVDPRAAQTRPRAAAGFSLRRISLRSWIAIGVCAFFGYVAISESMTPWPFTRNTSTSYGSPYGSPYARDHADADGKRRALAAMSSAQAATSPWTNDVSVASSDASSARPTFARPALGPNGLPWPSTASYLDGMPVGADGGHSSVTIDNTSNRFDVFAKLVFNASVFDQPVRHFFIPAGKSFTLAGVAPGSYDVRYQNLDDGGLYKSQNFAVTEQDSGNGVDATNVSITLYAVPGAVQPTTIGRGDF
ncbi:J domain-containing protein [Paraburkholderia azotifigens]|uniref:J domain-containing protein n=1 Tax=Paraburkholderia azotifigens TaxID=2057004 RepID=A0A5C6V9U3_9BURK|nr:J domain-containing protein [Paraburkholderia azotifigens]TXC82243.1 J domain-containing protein [Paraburkholderia azotifigens]TXC84776.1 J domain-containing protein [Paraburkholderia azotifigens]